MANASGDAYNSSSFSSDTSHVLIIENSDKVILSFRGTKEPRDWITDAEFFRIKLNDNIEIHEGFYKSWLSIKLQILDFVKTIDKPLYITGHSLGGALANICSWELSSQKIPFVGCITYGEPRSGNKTWIRQCDELFGERKIRLVNNVDIVPRIPGVLLGYRHTIRNIYISENGQLYYDPPLPVKISLDIMAIGYDFKKGQFGLLKDHYIVDYYNHLKLKFRA